MYSWCWGTNGRTMHNQQTATSAIALSPSLPQIQTAVEWLAAQSYSNLDLKIALHLVLHDRIIAQKTGERVAIAVESG